MSYPWHSTKYLVHIMSGSLSGIDINSISVELCALHFIIWWADKYSSSCYQYLTKSESRPRTKSETEKRRQSHLFISGPTLQSISGKATRNLMRELVRSENMDRQSENMDRQRALVSSHLRRQRVGEPTVNLQVSSNGSLNGLNTWSSTIY